MLTTLCKLLNELDLLVTAQPNSKPEWLPDLYSTDLFLFSYL